MAFLEPADIFIIILQVRFPGRVQAGRGSPEKFYGRNLRRAGHVQHELFIDFRQACKRIGMVLQRIPGGEKLQAEGCPETVFLHYCVPDPAFLFFGAHRKHIPEIRHFQGCYVRLENKLGNIRGRRGAFVQLFPDMFQFAGAPVILPLRFPPRKFPPGKAQHP